MSASLVGSEMCIRDRGIGALEITAGAPLASVPVALPPSGQDSVMLLADRVGLQDFGMSAWP
eukprot:8287162-Alexandrium_andersonii.AAC.1